MLTPDELHNTLVGKEIETVEMSTTSEDSIYSVELRFKDGTSIRFSPTSYNYGGQHLNIDIV